MVHPDGIAVGATQLSRWQRGETLEVSARTSIRRVPVRVCRVIVHGCKCDIPRMARGTADRRLLMSRRHELHGNGSTIHDRWRWSRWSIAGDRRGQTPWKTAPYVASGFSRIGAIRL